jgi:hypothetical protein
MILDSKAIRRSFGAGLRRFASIVDHSDSRLGTAAVPGAGFKAAIPARNTTLTANHIFAKQMYPLVRDVAALKGFEFESCLDIGCGRNPVHAWFEKQEYSSKPSQFAGIDSDPEIVSEMKAKGIDIFHPGEYPEDRRADLVIAKEVLEHIAPEDTSDFLSFCAKKTRKCFAMTTPNFEYWPKRRTAAPNEWCRWIPDHLIYLKPGSSNPHDHQQEMTVDLVNELLVAHFPAPEWNVHVVRAWPWTIVDNVTGNSLIYYFKIFAVAWLAD